MPTIHLNIGSNQGDRHAHVERAIALIDDIFEPATLRVSHPVESAPWGYESTNTFVNVAVAVDITAEQWRSRWHANPESVLDATRQIERQISDAPHRNADGSYRDRCIDIDIIAIDRLVVDTPRLTLPHPRAALRDFVMKPLTTLDASTARWIKSLAASAEDVPDNL